MDTGAFLRGLLAFGFWLLAGQQPTANSQQLPHADDASIEAAERRILAEQAALEDLATEASREDTVERVLEMRAALIREHPHHPRRARWLADQASDLFFMLLPIDASGLVTLFGLPSPTQRARAERVARSMNDLTEEAEIEIEGAILALESAPGYAGDVAAHLHRRRLSDRERQRRIPFLRGIGAHLHAKLNVTDPTQRRRLHALAAELLTPLGERWEGGPAATARLYAGLALLSLGALEDAEPPLLAVVADPASASGDVLAARLGLIRNRALRIGPQAALDALDELEDNHPHDLLVRLLVADQRFGLRRALASASGSPQRDPRIFDAYLELLDADLGVPAARLRAIVFARLVEAAGEDAPLERLPPIVTVAVAHDLAQAAAGRPAAIALLRGLLARRDLDEKDRSLALFNLGHSLLAADELAEAADRFFELALKHPTDPEAARSIELSATIATALSGKAPHDPEAPKRLARTLALLIEDYPQLAAIDRWRFDAAQLALAEGSYEEALSLFEQIPADAERWPDARLGRVSTFEAWAEAEAEPARRPQRYRKLLEVIDEVRPVLEQAAAREPQRRRHDVALLHVARARALLSLGEPKRALEALPESIAEASLERAIVAEALGLRIDAHEALGESAEAGRAIDGLLEVAPQEAGSILSDLLEARKRGVVTLLERGRSDEAARQAARKLVPVAEALERWAAGQSSGDPALVAARLRVAEAYRLGERWARALRLYDKLLAHYPSAVEVLFGRAECLWGLGADHDTQAMSIYKRIIGAATDVPEAYYWQSHLRMLQILDRSNRNTHRIAPHIERLRRRDPQLGGERFQRAFEILQNKYS